MLLAVVAIVSGLVFAICYYFWFFAASAASGASQYQELIRVEGASYVVTRLLLDCTQTIQYIYRVFNYLVFIVIIYDHLCTPLTCCLLLRGQMLFRA